MMNSGIYKIESRSNPERIYIGSSVDINGRWNDHKSELRKGIHKNGRLQNHYNKYGENDLIYVAVHFCDTNELIKSEQYFIDKLHPYFNISPTAGNTLGCVCSEETRNKIAAKQKGKKASEETKRKLSEARKGFKWSEEVKVKMRISAMGNKNAEGTVCSEETREKIRQGKLGNTWGFQKGHKKMGGNKKKVA